MITRLEIDGFKSFSNFAIDLPSFVAIVGPNASGKSNVFDAIGLLTRVVTMPLAEALANGRGDPEEQFRKRGDGSRVKSMRLAAELLLEPTVTDDFGSDVQLEHTRLRYEIRFSLQNDQRGTPRPLVESESIVPIKKGHDRLLRTVDKAFAEAHLIYNASQWKILETQERSDGSKVFALKGVRKAPAGRLFEIPARRAASSVLSSITTALDYPLLFAVRQEIESWRSLHIEPASVRQPSVVGSPEDHLSSNGGNLAWVLELIDRAAATQSLPGLNALATDLARVIRGFAAVEVRPNDARGQWEVYLRSRDEGEVSARVASDGTLRLLALLAALHEPDRPGVLCFEEPENGINPQRLTAMIDVLRGLVTDTAGAGVGRDTGLVQLLLSSHSPLLPLKLRPRELLVVDYVNLTEVGVSSASRVTRARRILESGEQLELGDVDAGWMPLPNGTETTLPGLTPADAQRIVDSQ